MTVQELKGKAYNKAFLTTELSYLVFGGQGSVLVSSIEYFPAKNEVRLHSEKKDTFKGPARFQDLLKLPDNTVILIEGYPGDDTHPMEWVTPNGVDINTQNMDFYHDDPEEEYDDNQKEIIHNAKEELYLIREELMRKGFDDREIKQIMTQFIQEAL